MYGMQWDIIQASLQAKTINALWRATPFLQVPLPLIHVIFVQNDGASFAKAIVAFV